MFYTFGRYKRSLLTVLGVLLASTLATASAATINMSQLTSNTAQPDVYKRQLLAQDSFHVSFWSCNWM